MGSPTIFSGRRTKLLTADGLLNKDGSKNDYDGVQNFILNGHAEVNDTGWVDYADAAGAVPVDGTGGSPSVTFTRSTTSPLSGSASFIFTKDAVNRQGQGASYDFTIDSNSKAKVLNISMNYMVNSGTFVAGSSSTTSDLVVYIYDVTNAVVIQPSSYKFLSNSSTLSDKFIANFQTSSNSTSYRLILHCATTSASAYTVKFDNICVCPSQYVYGTPITDWVSYTPTFTGFGTVTSVQFISRRVGSNLEINGRFTPGTGTGVQAQITLGYGGVSANVTVSNSVLPINGIVGHGGTARITPDVVQIMAAGNNNYLTLCPANTAIAGFSSALGSNFQSAVAIGFQATIPITGWSSSVQMSDSADTRVVAAKSYLSANYSAGANGAIVFNTISYDTHGAQNTSTGGYTIPVSGIYKISTVLALTATGSNIKIYKNGSALPGPSSAYICAALSTTSPVTGSTTASLVAGDIITIVSELAVTYQASVSSFSIERLTGPSAIAANELVAASYWLSANFTSSTTIPINFDSKEFDTHGAVTTGATTWKFTAPVSGTYSINGVIDAAATYVYIYKNGTIYKHIGYTSSAASTFMYPSSLVKLNAGDYIDIRCGTSSVVIGGATLATQTGANISISRVGF